MSYSVGRRSRRLAAAIAVVALAACDDDEPATPSEDTSSQNVQGGTALPGDQPSVENTNVGNPESPQDPGGTGP